MTLPRAPIMYLMILIAFLSAVHHRVSGHETPSSEPNNSEGKTYLLIARRPTVGPLSKQQKIGMAAVRHVAHAARTSANEIIIESGPDVIISPEHAPPMTERGSDSESFVERLKKLVQIVTPQDTVIIYTHSHGLKSRNQDEGSSGGLALDRPGTGFHPRGVLPWSEYAETIVEIPARNVVVLTMSCFSGELVNALNSPHLKPRWEHRRKAGRNLVVLTVQNASLTSGPIVKNSEIINPFTFTVSNLLDGAADGFTTVDGFPVKNGDCDGKLTVGEMIDFVLHTTENITSEYARYRNTSKPQLVGSFDRNDALNFGIGKHSRFDQSLESEDRKTSKSMDGLSHYVIASAFLNNDVDGDGRITRQEAEPVVVEAYEKIDQNVDGLIDQDEFRAVASHVIDTEVYLHSQRPGPRPKEDTVARLLSLNDANRDGKITREEAKPVIARNFDQFDRNSDNVVDEEEFKAVAPRFIGSGSGSRSNSQPQNAEQESQPADSSKTDFDFKTLRKGRNEITIEHDGLSRRLRVIVRPWIDLKTPTPVIFCFHGAGGGPENISARFAQATRNEDYIIVGVEAVKPVLKWNFKDGFHDQDYDDVGLVKIVVQKMIDDKVADAKALLAAGHSSGGLFCYRLAKESDMFAAIAPLSCGMVKGSHEPNEDTVPVPIFQLIGDQDKSFEGSENEKVTMYSAAERIAIWRKFNSCEEQPTVDRSHEGLVVSTYRCREKRSNGKQSEEDGYRADVVLCIAAGEAT